MDFKQVILSVTQNSDVLFYTGNINRTGYRLTQGAIQRRTKRKNTLALVLTTGGGDPHAAYKIARCIARSYPNFAIWITSYCKSAGTLMCLGAKEIVMSDSAEIGPLDMQVRKPEELGEFGSGLDIIQALSFLEAQTSGAFVRTLTNLREKGLATKIAGEIATSLSNGIYSGILSQIDPLRLGEVSRAMRIGEHYASRLAKWGDNVEAGAIDTLIATYPSHDFVIDREEASGFFKRIRAADSDRGSHRRNVRSGGWRRVA